MIDHVFICGSRDISQPGRDFARLCVLKAVQNGSVILVGDAPGVDETVVRACEEFQAACVCVGVTIYPRNGGAQNERSVYCSLNDSKFAENWKFYLKHRPKRYNYPLRDRYLVTRASIVMCVWNGTSRGTKTNHDYALKLGKKAFIRTFENEK